MVTFEYVDDNGNRLVIRGCGLDSGSLTSDTEIVRVSHCGSFYLDGRYRIHANLITTEFLP